MFVGMKMFDFELGLIKRDHRNRSYGELLHLTTRLSLPQYSEQQPFHWLRMSYGSDIHKPKTVVWSD